MRGFNKGVMLSICLLSGCNPPAETSTTAEDGIDGADAWLEQREADARDEMRRRAKECGFELKFDEKGRGISDPPPTPEQEECLNRDIITGPY